MVKYYRIQKQNQSQLIEEDKIERFLEEGWHKADSAKTEKPKTSRSKKISSRQAITATAEIKHSVEDILKDVEDTELTSTVDGNVSTESFDDNEDKDNLDTN